MQEAAFLTEVHHINGEGEDAGVVYSEMQARENTGESLCMLGLLRTVYPAPCGYGYETGGLMKNLRESTTNKKVPLLSVFRGELGQCQLQDEARAQCRR